MEVCSELAGHRRGCWLLSIICMTEASACHRQSDGWMAGSLQADGVVLGGALTLCAGVTL